MKATKQRASGQKSVTLKDLTSVKWYAEQFTGKDSWESSTQVEKIDELWKKIKPRSDEERQWRALWRYAMPRMRGSQPFIMLLQSASEMPGAPAVRAAVSTYIEKGECSALADRALLLAQGPGQDAADAEKWGKVLRMCVHRNGMCVAVHDKDVVSVWRPDGTLVGTEEIKDKDPGYTKTFARLVGDALLVVKNGVSVVRLDVRCDGAMGKDDSAKENNPVVAYWDSEYYDEEGGDGLPILQLPDKRCFAWNSGNLDRALMTVRGDALASMQLLEESYPLTGVCAHVLYDARSEDRQRVRLRRLEDWQWHMHVRRLDMVWLGTDDGVAIYDEDGTMQCQLHGVERGEVRLIDEDVVITSAESSGRTCVWRIAEATGPERVIRKPLVEWRHATASALRLRDGGFAVVEANGMNVIRYAANGQREQVLKCPRTYDGIASLVELPDGRILAGPIGDDDGDWFEGPPVVWNRAGKREDVATDNCGRYQPPLPMVSGEVWGIGTDGLPLFGTRTDMPDLQALGALDYVYDEEGESWFLYSWSPRLRVQVFRTDESYGEMISAFLKSSKVNQGKCCLSELWIAGCDYAVSAVSDGRSLILFKAPDDTVYWDGAEDEGGGYDSNEDRFIDNFEKGCRSTELKKKSEI